MLDTIQKTLDTALEDDPASGTYRVARDIFTDPAIFELEMKHIFEGNWIYLAHESQIPNNNDYFTTTMGRQPIFIARSQDGRAERLHQCMQPPRCDALPPQAREQDQLYLPIPRLDVQQRRQTDQGEGPAGRGLSGNLRQETARTT